MSDEAGVQWLTCTPSGRAHTCEPDDGRTGWRLHAVIAANSETLKQIGHRIALCGLMPKNGWDMDLFVEDRCKRCAHALENRKVKR